MCKQNYPLYPPRVPREGGKERGKERGEGAEAEVGYSGIRILAAGAAVGKGKGCARADMGGPG